MSIAGQFMLAMILAAGSSVPAAEPRNETTAEFDALLEAAIKWADDVASFPVSNRPAALVAGEDDIADRVDQKFYNKLEALGYEVEVVDDNDWQKWAPTGAAGKDLILILVVHDSCTCG